MLQLWDLMLCVCAVEAEGSVLVSYGLGQKLSVKHPHLNTLCCVCLLGGCKPNVVLVPPSAYISSHLCLSHVLYLFLLFSVYISSAYSPPLTFSFKFVYFISMYVFSLLPGVNFSSCMYSFFYLYLLFFALSLSFLWVYILYCLCLALPWVCLLSSLFLFIK